MFLPFQIRRVDYDYCRTAWKCKTLTCSRYSDGLFKTVNDSAVTTLRICSIIVVGLHMAMSRVGKHSCADADVDDVTSCADVIS